MLEGAGPMDWLSEFKKLKPSWDEAILRDRAPLGLALDEARAPPHCGGQDPRVFCLGSGKFLLLPGAFFAEQRGGYDLQQDKVAYLLDAGDPSRQLTWRSVEVLGEPPPGLHGNYCGTFGDGAVADKVACFAGRGNSAVHDESSLLEIAGLADDGTAAPNPSVRWSRLRTFGTRQPCARFAGFGIVWDKCLLAYAGRGGPHFFDELWRLDLTSLEWTQPSTSGQGPSPRVWLRGARCGETLLLYGGAEWRFDLGCWGNDTPGTVWALHVADLRWERLQLSGMGFRPPLRASPALAVCGRHLLVFGGLDLPTQEYLDDAWAFDTLTRRWSEIELDIDDTERRWCRSHCAAVFCHERKSCLVFGGGRYLEGVYFHEVLQLTLPVQRSRPR